jgi:CRP-like cAMP-binding protein
MNEPPSGFDIDAFLAKMDGGKHIVEYGQDQIVFSQGDAADAVFYIQNGQVGLRVVSEQGKEAVVALLDAGSFFGEGCLAGQSLRMASAITMTDSTIVRIEKPAMFRVIHDEPLFSESFIAHLLARAVRVEADLAGC